MTWHMVTCARCKLLVGWMPTEPPQFYCIPCFDFVALGGREEEAAAEPPPHTEDDF